MKTPSTLSDVPRRRKGSRPELGRLLDSFLRRDCRGVANDLPSGRRLLNYEQKITVRVASSSHSAFKVKISRNRREVFVERLHLKPRKAECAHLLLGRVALAIGIQHLCIASRDRGTHKENVRRILI